MWKGKRFVQGEIRKRSFKAKNILRALLAALAALPSALNLTFKTIIICLVSPSFWGLLSARWVKGRERSSSRMGRPSLPIFGPSGASAYGTLENIEVMTAGRCFLLCLRGGGCLHPVACMSNSIRTIIGP